MFTCGQPAGKNKFMSNPEYPKGIDQRLQELLGNQYTGRLSRIISEQGREHKEQVEEMLRELEQRLANLTSPDEQDKFRLEWINRHNHDFDGLNKPSDIK